MTLVGSEVTPGLLPIEVIKSSLKTNVVEGRIYLPSKVWTLVVAVAAIS